MEENIKNIIGDTEYRILKNNGKDVYVTKDGRLINYKGREIGSHNSFGYKVVNFNGRTHQVSHLIWEAFNGEIPSGLEIDHINTVRDDNRLENLRTVNHKENCNNQLTLKHYKENREYLKDRNGEKNPMYGKHHSQESKDKMRLSALKRQAKIKSIISNKEELERNINGIAFIIEKGLYDEYTKWVYKKIINKFKIDE